MTTQAQPPTILVGLDTSPRARHVLDVAIDMTRRLGGKLVLARAVGIPVEMPMEAFVMSPSDLPALLDKIAREDLTRLAATVPPELLGGIRVHDGVPWQALVDEATECKAVMLIVGSHGYGTLDRLLGTTAARIVNHATCDTLVVRPEGKAKGAA